MTQYDRRNQNEMIDKIILNTNEIRLQSEEDARSADAWKK